MPRKSDTSRRSDVSMARVAPADNEPAAAVSSPAPIAIAPNSSTLIEPSPTTPAPAAAADISEMDVERASESAAPSDKKDRDTVAIEDLNLPKSIITRLAKGVLPPNTQIQANAILAMTKAATVFINHLANAANERTLNSNKKTIMPFDVFDALDDIEYPEFKDLVQKEFKKFNEVQSSKRNNYRRKVAAAKKGVPYVDTPGLLREPRVPEATGPPGTTFIEDPAAAAGIDTSRSIKKQRMSTSHPPNGADGGGGMNPDASAVTDVDADMTQEYQDADSEPDELIEEDEDESEDEPDHTEQESSEDVEDTEDDEMHDALEEREERDGEDEDEALDNGEDSDS